MIETIIVGAGPGGLQLAYLMQRAGREYTVLEQADGAGAFFAKYPVHRQLISINKVNTGKADKEFNLRHDWNSLLDEEGYTFGQFSQELFPNADLAVDYLQGFADHHGLKVQYNRRVASIHTENLRSHGEGRAACGRTFSLGWAAFLTPTPRCARRRAADLRAAGGAAGRLDRPLPLQVPRHGNGKTPLA